MGAGLARCGPNGGVLLESAGSRSRRDATVVLHSRCSTARRRDAPRALAARTYNSRSSSITLARVIRASTAASGAPSVIAGSTRFASVPRPETGSHPSETEKTMASKGPSQKFGTEMPMSASVVAAKSTAVPARAAATTPRGMAIDVATTMAAAASSSVAGSRSAMAARTG